jgi:hypothetical protein
MMVKPAPHTKLLTLPQSIDPRYQRDNQRVFLRRIK